MKKILLLFVAILAIALTGCKEKKTEPELCVLLYSNETKNVVDVKTYQITSDGEVYIGEDVVRSYGSETRIVKEGKYKVKFSMLYFDGERTIDVKKGQKNIVYLDYSKE